VPSTDFWCLSKEVAREFRPISVDPKKKIEKKHQQVSASPKQLLGAILEV